MTATAWAGATVSASSGTATIPNPPSKPPLEMPVTSTAGTATR